jgi:hypothetical protein
MANTRSLVWAKQVMGREAQRQSRSERCHTPSVGSRRQMKAELDCGPDVRPVRIATQDKRRKEWPKNGRRRWTQRWGR